MPIQPTVHPDMRQFKHDKLRGDQIAVDRDKMKSGHQLINDKMEQAFEIVRTLFNISETAKRNA